MEILATAVREGKVIKSIQISKVDMKVSLLEDDMILYIENPKDSIKNFELTSEFRKVS